MLRGVDVEWLWQGNIEDRGVILFTPSGRVVKSVTSSPWMWFGYGPLIVCSCTCMAVMRSFLDHGRAQMNLQVLFVWI